MPDSDIDIVAYAGHSLGEYSALCAAKVLNFDAALRLVEYRGRLMASCCSDEHGMMAVLGYREEEIRDMLSSDVRYEDIEVANINSKTQIVLAGIKSDLKCFDKGSVTSETAKVKYLNVAGAFHTRYMKEANEKLGIMIDGLDFSDPDAFFIPNQTGVPSKDGKEIKAALKKQMISAVRWYASIISIKDLGIDVFYEVGPGNTLKKINSTILFKPKCKSID